MTKRFGRVIAVNQLSFEVEPGQILALLGPNGAGKTTTLLCLAGLLRPDAGRILWAGTALGPQRGRSMALIPDTPEVYEMLTVWEHLVFVASSCRLDAEWSARARRLLDRLGIATQRDTLGEALSKGMRQKLLIACSVIARAPVLLLDEPMIGLDPSGQRELKDILLEVRDEGAAIIVSSHLLEYMEPLCDQLLIIKEGQRVLGGPLGTLLGQRRQSLEELFLEATT